MDDEQIAWQEKQEALAYLAATDWYVVRALECSDKPVPKDITVARQEARDRIKT